MAGRQKICYFILRSIFDSFYCFIPVLSQENIHDQSKEIICNQSEIIFSFAKGVLNPLTFLFLLAFSMCLGFKAAFGALLQSSELKSIVLQTFKPSIQSNEQRTWLFQAKNNYRRKEENFTYSVFKKNTHCALGFELNIFPLNSVLSNIYSK